MSPESFTAALDRAKACSRFLVRMLDSRPWLHGQLSQSVASPLDADAMRAFIARQGADEAALLPTLRQLRCWVICHLIVRDIAVQAPLDEVTETMTQLAEVAVGHAYAVLYDTLIQRYGRPVSNAGWEQEMLIIGMGKLGGRELNVSSDIDLIFVYPEEGDTVGPKIISNYEFFERLGKRLINALADITEHGQVFRVDMRLRPNGDSGPLVANFDMLENYFITQGREWERYAWIKARALTGERWQELESISRPFIYRKYLDYGAIYAMRDLHAQIRREVSRRDRIDNIKLGPGGIREIEFIAQAFQLIRGGRDEHLRVRATLKVLALLSERGILEQAEVALLTDAYIFLRRLEHRLQYLEDAQTHDLPAAEEDREIVAQAMGFATFAELENILGGYRGKVSNCFDKIFAAPDDETASNDAWNLVSDVAGATEKLAEMGFARPGPAAERLAAIRRSVRYRNFSESIRSRFDSLLPRIIEVALTLHNPDETLMRCLDLIESISGRASYLALLQQYPHALKRVADLVGASPWAAHYLMRHPILLDELLDARLLETITDWTALQQDLTAQLDSLEPDMEAQMDRMREVHHAQVFRLLAQDLGGALTTEQLADHLSRLADIVVELTIPLCWRKLRKKHREEPLFAVISYGKLGGQELGYGSDIDLVFIFDDDAPEAGETYARLGQRINTWLSSQTAAGILFETDLRLRPNGESGLLTNSLEAFRKYQLECAWVWEHQALTRARFTAGDPRIGEAFERIRHEVLCLERDVETLKNDVRGMRHKMRQVHSDRHHPLFDLKHDAGGIIDTEFIIQFLVLGYSSRHPALSANLGNIALLRMAGELALIPEDLARAAASSYRQYRKLQHRQRLNGHSSRVRMEEVSELCEPVQTLWQIVFEEHIAFRPD